jgi:hypothetical protein
MHHVWEDDSEVPIGVQTLLAALAWRTPRGKDATVPTTHADLAKMTRYSVRSIPRLVKKAIKLNAIEIVWSKPGPGGTRYRVNRGEWHIPRDEAAEALKEARLARDQGRQPELKLSTADPSSTQIARYSEEEVVRDLRGSTAQFARSSTRSARRNEPDQGEQASKDLRDIRSAEVDDSPKVVDRRLAALTSRIAEKYGPW